MGKEGILELYLTPNEMVFIENQISLEAAIFRIGNGIHSSRPGRNPCGALRLRLRVQKCDPRTFVNRHSSLLSVNVHHLQYPRVYERLGREVLFEWVL
jgi:hypothetical protein